MNKKDWTPGETELKEALDKVYENDTRMPARPLDLSFMDNPPVEKKPSKKRTYLLRIAAVVAIILVTSITTAIFVSNDYACAIQDKLQRKVFEMKHGVVVATDEEFAEEGETVWEITDFDTAVKAKELVPELPIPGYVPNEYVFSKLKLFIYIDGSFSANYIYEKNATELFISFQPLPEENTSYSWKTDNSIKTDHYIVSFWNDPLINSQGASVLFEDMLCDISTNNTSLPQDEIIKIIGEL